jgi:hypothetical protein
MRGQRDGPDILPPQRPCREPLFDVHPQTGATIEVFYADRSLETFGQMQRWLVLVVSFPHASPENK